MLPVSVEQLVFAYSNGPPVLRELSLSLPRGARCLLVGRNGSGKTTLLSILAGRHLIDDRRVRVLARPVFSDTSLVNDVSYLGGNFPLDVDLTVKQLLLSRRDADPTRRDRLIDILDVDRGWHMHRVSDGQRRRVQILLSLLHPAELLLLDEVTTDLDVLARIDLLQFLRSETESRGATIIYATHIFDGLESWATHLAWLEGGRIERFSTVAELEELSALRKQAVSAPLVRLVERWLREAP